MWESERVKERERERVRKSENDKEIVIESNKPIVRHRDRVKIVRERNKEKKNRGSK